MAKLKTFQFKVTGEQTIHCKSCANAIQLGLARLPGARQVRADHQTQLIEVNVDVDQTSLDTVRARLDWMGYQTQFLDHE